MRGGSKKGERRGNARKRNPLDPVFEKPEVELVRKPKPQRKPKPLPENVTAIVPTANQIMHEAVKNPALNRETTERKIEIAKLIHGSDPIYDMTPKEAMLESMHELLAAKRAEQSMLAALVGLPMPEEPEQAKVLTQQIVRCEYEIERLRDKVTDTAYRVSPMIHPRLAAVQVRDDSNHRSDSDLINELFDEADARYREGAIIDHRTDEKKTG